MWNYCLDANNQHYQATGKGTSALTMKKWLPKVIITKLLCFFCLLYYNFWERLALIYRRP
ncbi:MAG: hypothetical protein AB4426_16850 [Xenococcaceae cyanobacterium]